jgi:peptidoglycan-N-acetylglucosamine deacetylase
VIGTQGEILTNAHVVEACSEINVRFPSGNSELAVLVARDERNDLAAIRASLTNIPATSVATFRDGPVRAGDAVVALGYPLSGLLASTANLSVGNVSALAGLADDSRYLQISAPVQPGNSGGPLLDASGHVVGIVTAKLNAARVAKFTGDIPQNVNFALKVEVARTFLDSKGIAYRKATPSDQQLSPADVGDIARPFTVHIECEQTASRVTATPKANVPPQITCAGNPNALGVSRIVEIDTTGGPQFGLAHFTTNDFLRPGEVVLTFDDGPWPKNTPAVLAALAAHCTKAIFFAIGVHATYEPGILKQVAAAGHAVGSHTWCHQDLSKTKGRCQISGKIENVEYDPKDEIEKGVSAVRWAVGGPTAPYFRFPALRMPPELLAYLAQRNIAVFSADIDSYDFRMRRPEEVRQSVMAQLGKFGKGIVSMHDFQHATAEAAMDLLNDLKAGGYKIVLMRPKKQVKTIAEYDAVIAKLTNTSLAPASSP